MATRGAIIKKNEDGSYEGIYAHNVDNSTAATLKEFYGEEKRIARLIALGDISFLRKFHAPTISSHSFNTPQKDVTVAYHRDRQEPKNISRGISAEAVANSIGHNGYVFLFENGKWTLNGKAI